MNTGSKDANGKTIYTVADQKQPARLEFKTKLQTDNTYYLQAPYSLRKSKGVIGIQLNDRWYRYTQSYDETQLWNIASRQKDEDLKLSFDFYVNEAHQEAADKSLAKLEYVRAADDDIAKVLEARRKQGLNVTSWGNTFIKAKTNITDDSTVMITSIPYNPGWKVKVDGKEVSTKEVWGSLLSFPITKGKHKVEMTFTPDGFWLGTFISLGTGIAVVLITLKFKKQGDTNASN